MRILLLTARPTLAVNTRLTEAARTLGVEVDVRDATRVCAAVGTRPLLTSDGDDLLEPVPDAVIARVGNWRPDSILAALEVVVGRGAVTANSPHAIRRARDHWRTVQTLAAAGIPVPDTIAGADPEQLAASAARLGFPVVVKQRRSRMGVGVIRVDQRDHLEAVLDSLWRLGDEVAVQRFIPSGGESLRLLVVDFEVVAAARMCAADGDWRSNAAQGGSIRPHAVSERELELAVAAARELELGVCGVDLFPGAELVVGEANPTPGFIHLERATGVDVAGAMIRDLVLRVDAA
jgi:RimK family alpha-L-glutamate ligase